MVPAVPNAFHLHELHQIATCEERRTLDERCLQIEEEAAKYRARRTELRERELAFKQAAAAHLLSNGLAISSQARSAPSPAVSKKSACAIQQSSVKR